MEKTEWLVWLTVIAGLTAGWFLRTSITGQVISASAGSSTLAYPANWVRLDQSENGFTAADLQGGGSYGPRISVRHIATDEIGLAVEGSLADIAASWSLRRGKDLVGYRVLGIEHSRVAEHPAMKVDLVYLADPPQGFFPGVMPGLMHAVDTVVTSGDRVYVMTFEAESHQFARFSNLHQKFLESWNIP